MPEAMTTPSLVALHCRLRICGVGDPLPEYGPVYRGGASVWTHGAYMIDEDAAAALMEVAARRAIREMIAPVDWMEEITTSRIAPDCWYAGCRNAGARAEGPTELDSLVALCERVYAAQQEGAKQE